MGEFIDRSGFRYGQLLVVGRIDSGPASEKNRTRWLCRCDCGSETVATGHALAKGDKRSCGCLRRRTAGERLRTHGMSRTPTYRSWQAAKERCHNPNNARYASYGGSGIAMCERWRNSFDAFLEDMGKRPLGKTLDRVDQCRGYEPGNCQWATAAEQSLTRGTTRLYRWRGTWMTVRQISEVEGITYNTLRKLARRAHTIQIAVAETKAKKRQFLRQTA